MNDVKQAAHIARMVGVGALIGIVLAGFAASPHLNLHWHRFKHTGPVMFSGSIGTHCFWFQRPNHEVFESCFDNPPPFQPGMQLDDITYQDDNQDMRHFVKAQFPAPVGTPSPMPVAPPAPIVTAQPKK